MLYQLNDDKFFVIVFGSLAIAFGLRSQYYDGIKVIKDTTNAAGEVLLILKKFFFVMYSNRFNIRNVFTDGFWASLLHWPQNTQNVTDCINFLRHISWHTFGGLVMLWYVLYNEFANNFISLIFQTDKYGIVLLYVLSIVPGLWMRCKDIADQSVRYKEALQRHLADLNPATLTAPQPPWFWNNKLNVMTLMALLTFSKSVAFTLIFKFHTSSKSAHQNAHIVMVFVLGVLTVWYRLLTSAVVGLTGAQVRAGVVRAIRYIIFFQVVGWWQDNQVLSREWHVNAWVTYWEANLIVETMY